MAGDLQAQHATGATLYAVLVDANGGVWNGAAFDATPTSGEWASYDIAMAEQGSAGYYVGDLPGVSAGRYGYRVHKQLAGTPAATDPVVWTGELDTNATPPSVADFWSGITATAGRFIADHTLRRSWASAAVSANGDTLSFRSLLGAVAKLVNRVGISGATLTVYQDDDTTALGEQTLTSDAAAEPITQVNTV